jgi:hypothetical protein
LINNRQGGRRRGRGGQRGQNIGGQPGNRQDNRQRGNAAQLLEKYKSMARDAQLSGDRVQTEYYLQYADHYFRVLSENRSRFEDQRPRREHETDEDEGDEEFVEAEEAAAEERPQRQERGERFNRERRPRRDDRDERRTREESEDDGAGPNGGQTIPFDVLPPAIGREETPSAESDDDAPRRPRRRTRAARPAEGEDEIAPAA